MSQSKRWSDIFHQTKTVTSDRRDDEFLQYQKQTMRRHHQFVKVREITGDLFETDKKYSLAHCVAEDMRMGKGIAVAFRHKFKRVDELLNQRQKTGGVAILSDKNRFVYYLVTKKCSSRKPTMSSLFSSLKSMREHVMRHKVRKLAMPRIGCGLDRLDWSDVKLMIEFVFAKVDIDIVVCSLEPEATHNRSYKNRFSSPVQVKRRNSTPTKKRKSEGMVSETKRRKVTSFAGAS